MRNLIVGAAALLAVAAPGVAAAQTGYAGVIYESLDVEGLGDAEAYGVEGAVAFAGSDMISFEIDASAVDSDEADTALGLTGHAFTRNDAYLFGAFAGVVDSDQSTTWTAGLEGNAYFEAWTLAGALFYANNDDVDADGYGVNVEGRLFLTDNFRVQGNVGWADVQFSGSDDTALTYGVGGEYQFDAMPISIALGYARTELDDSGGEVDAAVVALRYNWGGTLRDRDRNGASQANIVGFGPSFLAL